MSILNNRKVVIGSLALNAFFVAFVLAKTVGFCPSHDRHHGWQRDVFSREEMKQEKPYMKAQFGKVRELRKAFGEQLIANSVTPETIRAHFAEVDKVMAETKSHMHEKMIAKITAMSPAERKALGEKMMKKGRKE